MVLSSGKQQEGQEAEDCYWGSFQITPNKISMRITLKICYTTPTLPFLRMKTFSFAGGGGGRDRTNNVPALYSDPIPASSHSYLKERYYLQFTNEENQHPQDAFYSEIIQVIHLENCYQWRIIPGDGTVEDRGERNQN